MRTAAEVLAMYWDGRVPVDVEGIAARAGIKIERVTFHDDTICETGLVGGVKTIRVSAVEGNIRTRFAIAHAMGHVFLHESSLRELPPL